MGTGDVKVIRGSQHINMAGKIDYIKHWVIDSGATEHITCDGNTLESSINPLVETPVKIPNGDVMPVKNIGNASLPNGLKIERVLHVPDFQCNLLSVSRLTKEYNCVLIFFFPDFYIMQDLASRNLIGVGKQRDGLYNLEPVKDGRTLLASVSLETWHKRLGHTSRIKLLHNNSSGKIVDDYCDPCMRAKQTRSPFPTSTIKTSDVLS